MISCYYEGKVLDFHWKKQEHGYLFYIGAILVGQVYRIGKHNWSAFGYGNKGLRAEPVDGFGSRYFCAKYLLEAQGYWKKG